MSPTIRISDDVYEHLKQNAEPFVDTPDSVLRRLLGLDDGEVGGHAAADSASEAVPARTERAERTPGAATTNANCAGKAAGGSLAPLVGGAPLARMASCTASACLRVSRSASRSSTKSSGALTAGRPSTAATGRARRRPRPSARASRARVTVSSTTSMPRRSGPPTLEAKPHPLTASAILHPDSAGLTFPSPASAQTSRCYWVGCCGVPDAANDSCFRQPGDQRNRSACRWRERLAGQNRVE